MSPKEQSKYIKSWTEAYAEVRAKTEERHLSRDPKYVQYATWVNENGLLRFLNWIPGVQYKKPTSSFGVGRG